MRQTIGVVAAAALLLGATQLPAAAASPEAPTDLQLSWVTDNHKVKIAWTDGGEANIVRVEYQGGGVSKLVTWRADLPNEYIRSGVALAAVDRVVRISVVSVDAAGAESAPVVSPWFDTIGAPVPTFTAATPLADGSLKLDWSLSDVPADTTLAIHWTCRPRTRSSTWSSTAHRAPPDRGSSCRQAPPRRPCRHIRAHTRCDS